jgi:hypothetical protein
MLSIRLLVLHFKKGGRKIAKLFTVYAMQGITKKYNVYAQEWCGKLEAQNKSGAVAHLQE